MVSPRVIWTILKKDFREAFGSRAVWLPAVLQPLGQAVLIPLACYGFVRYGASEVFGDIPPEAYAALLPYFPPHLLKVVHGLPPVALLAILATGHLIAPLLMTTPANLTAIAGSAAFVAEKERRTLEALLYTPASDVELLLGKLLAALAGPLLLAWSTLGLYAVGENLATWQVLHDVWFPTPIWLVWFFWVLPAALVLLSTCTVVVSTRTRTQFAAGRLAGLFGVFVLWLMGMQVLGIVQASTATAWRIGGLAWAADVALLWLSVRLFSRDRLIRRM